jgi:hypothetical protein
MIGVLVDADLHQGGIDLDRINVIRAVSQCLGHVAAVAGADYEDIAELVVGEPAVDLGVDGLQAGLANRVERLVRDAVDPDVLEGHVVALGAVADLDGVDAVVGGPDFAHAEVADHDPQHQSQYGRVDVGPLGHTATDVENGGEGRWRW